MEAMLFVVRTLCLYHLSANIMAKAHYKNSLDGGGSGLASNVKSPT
jgi:hypothetical protein